MKTQIKAFEVKRGMTIVDQKDDIITVHEVWNQGEGLGHVVVGYRAGDMARSFNRYFDPRESITKIEEG